MTLKKSYPEVPHVAVVGGGIAGSTAALHLAEQGIRVTLLEQGPGLVNGPPICHLHAGGNLYREISSQHCIDLLRQSIETVRLYPFALNIRPTVIATPVTDSGSAEALIPRLKVIRQAYQQLVDEDPANAVLGEPEHYYKLYQRDELEHLARCQQAATPTTVDDWLIPFARNVRLDQLKYPVVVVQEFGLSVFRLAASVTLALDNHPGCQVLTNCCLQQARETENGWSLVYQDEAGDRQTLAVDYLVNASGYRSGSIDDMTAQPRQRLVEFKSAYVCRWPDNQMQWPEVIFHGERGTPQGMAQLTPYADGYFQLHGMTQQITLFADGLVKSDTISSQPQLPSALEAKIRTGWQAEIVNQRTERAIAHVSQFIPGFVTASTAGKPLFGAQQIPGGDPNLRAVDVSFTDKRYVRIEIVKASSAYQAAQKISQHLLSAIGRAEPATGSIELRHPHLAQLSRGEVETKAIELAISRQYPEELAKESGIMLAK